MGQQMILQAGETLLRKDAVSLVVGRIASRTGVCYLTDRRIVVVSESLLIGVAAGLSIIARATLRKANKLGTQQQEIALRRLTHFSFSKYGLNQSVDIPLGDGTTLRMVMGAKQRQKWLAALDKALRSQNLVRVSDGEETWRVRPAG